MFSLSQAHRYYLYTRPTDMRKGFDGLSGLVINQMKQDPLDGRVYIFINRGRDKIKLLVWESGGYVLYYKRLEKGVFELPKLENNPQNVSISWQMLAMMIQGLSVEKIIQKKRYQRA